jgi:hypothetical protein
MKLIKLFAILILSVVLINPVSAQLNRKQIKSNRKAMSKWKGKKNTFTKEKKYFSIGFSVNSMSYLGDIAPKASWGRPLSTR